MDNQTDGWTNRSKRITLAHPAKAQLEEKKSVFIGHAVPVTDEDTAREFVAGIKHDYRDATHNVYAYLLDDGVTARYSDDGEPQGTAGIPVLNVLKMSGATDLCVVVTRYFGGTLLGAGGLVRAYGAAAKAAIDAAGIVTMENYALLDIKCSYSDYQRLTVMLERLGVSEDGASFETDVSVRCAVEEYRIDELKQNISELTGGRSTVTFTDLEERASRL